MNIKNNNKGFSLIELSIVLIIIGLLVSGITGGASLIKSAELRSIMTEARGYKMAVNAYYTSEDVLPGDDGNTSDRGSNNLASTVGNENGKIEAHSAANVTESIEAWNDMSDSEVGILDMTTKVVPVVTTTTATIAAGDLLGDSKYKGAGWTFDYSIQTESDTTARDVNSNILILTGATTAATTGTALTAFEMAPAGILSGSDAYSIDKKMDDAELTSGSVIGMDGNTSAGTAQATKCDEDETATDICAMAFKIDL